MGSTSIVLGLGFGDEGKGVTTDYLCSKAHHPLVVRFSGGQQAGHTVVANNVRHVFSSFGSGTLRNIPTFWSSYCTVYPLALLAEYQVLQQKNINPILYLDQYCPVTTFYDVAYNRAIQSVVKKHGTVGLGFGTTIKREEFMVPFHMQDLYDESKIKDSLTNIRLYYDLLLQESENSPACEEYKKQLKILGDDSKYIELCQHVTDVVMVKNEYDVFQLFDDVIFEGSQGILLDQDSKFFPHVTPSYTTSRNAHEIIIRNNLSQPDIYYVSRVYHTRHGNGPLSAEHFPVKLKNNEFETNISAGYQGKFRTCLLDLDLVDYALKYDQKYSTSHRKNLSLTCLDQVDHLQITHSGINTVGFDRIVEFLDYIDCIDMSFDKLLLNDSPITESIKESKYPIFVY